MRNSPRWSHAWVRCRRWRAVAVRWACRRLGDGDRGESASVAKGKKAARPMTRTQPATAARAASTSSMATPAARVDARRRIGVPATGLGAALAGVGDPAAAGRIAPILADALLAEPMLQTVAALARLTRPAPSRSTSPTESPLALPGALANQLAQWMAHQIDRPPGRCPCPAARPSARSSQTCCRTPTCSVPRARRNTASASQGTPAGGAAGEQGGRPTSHRTRQRPIPIA